MSDKPIFTYQTRPVLTTGQDGVLDAYAALFCRAERSLLHRMQSGTGINELKRTFQPLFGISARQFNAIRVGIEGKVDAVKERRPELIAEAEQRIKKAVAVIARLEVRAKGSAKLHQKKRRLLTMRSRLERSKAEQAAGTVKLCFGSKKLFYAQFDLTSNGYASHDAWKADWQRARSRQFFVIGSRDETAGCGECQAHLAPDGSVTLQLRLPDALREHGKYLHLKGIRFAYGHDTIVAALLSSRRVTTVTKSGKAGVKRTGTALSYRFLRDDKGWRVFASVAAIPVPIATHKLIGAIGIDINADHLAIADIDRYGNLVGVRRIDTPTYGKTTDQAKAIIGDAVLSIVTQAKQANKPVIIEKLNFQAKKAGLEAVSPKQARMLSSFACNKVASGIRAGAFRAGVDVIEVNPAYTSVIGAVNHARLRGISVHQGAAFAIARRGLDLSERPIVREGLVPVRNGGHVTFTLPVRNRAKHVWSFWSKVRINLKAAHVAHFRSGESNNNPAPLSPVTLTSGASWNSTAQFRGANRSQNCSGDVWPEVPF